MNDGRYTGLVISHGENSDDTYFDMMLRGWTFRLTPVISHGAGVILEEVVRVCILQVHAHPKYHAALIVFKTVEVDETRMCAGIYALVFREGLVCESIPREPLDKDVSDPEILVGNIRACVEQFCTSPMSGV